MQSNAKNLTSKCFNGAEKLTKNHLDEMRSATVSISAIVHADFCLFLGPINPFDVTFFALLRIFKYAFSTYNKPQFNDKSFLIHCLAENFQGDLEVAKIIVELKKSTFIV